MYMHARTYLIMLPAFLRSTVSHTPHQTAAATSTQPTPTYSVIMSPVLRVGSFSASAAAAGLLNECARVHASVPGSGVDHWSQTSKHPKSAVWSCVHTPVGLLEQLSGLHRLQPRHEGKVGDDAQVEDEKNGGPHVLGLRGRWFAYGVGERTHVTKTLLVNRTPHSVQTRTWYLGLSPCSSCAPAVVGWIGTPPGGGAAYVSMGCGHN